MNFGGWLQSLGLLKAPAPTPVVPPAAPRGSVVAMARPTYTQLTGNALLPRAVSFDLLRQFHRSVPVMGRAIDILSTFAGCPEIVSDDKALAADLALWADSVKFGDVGQGLGAFVKDHLGQALLYGFGVGEVVANPQRNDLGQLWSYLSPAFQFRTDPTGEFRIVQYGFGQEILLNPDTSLLTVPISEGCNPNGRSLYFSSLSFAEAWTQIAFAFRQTWLRNGVPRYHVNWSPAAELEDPEGTVALAIVQEMSDTWNEGMRSSVMDGVTKDYFTSGTTTVSVIGHDGAVIDITISKRAVVEEIVCATGIPAWLLGYSWSTTERLSTQQADMLLATLDTLRRAMTPTLKRVVGLRQQLAARKGAWDLVWPDVNLQDLLQTAQADFTTQKARQTRQAVGRQLWTDGVWTQVQYAEDLTGSQVVAVAMAEPPATIVPADPTAGVNQPPATGANSLLEALEWELGLPPLKTQLEEYEGRFLAACNGKH